MHVKDKILELRSQGKSYKYIVKILGCSRGTVSYHCGKGQKEKTYNRTKLFRLNNAFYKESIHYVLNRKMYVFCASKKDRKQYQKPIKKIRAALYHKYQTFIYRKNKSLMDAKFTFEELVTKIGNNPICYLTGMPIDLTKSSTYQFDHIIPHSRGGDDTLDNLGICTKRANESKNNMTPEELFELCKSILTHNGYTVVKN
jgi:CRISPR/Cas system Type II protein with McrA/HNH and RuvC-like nuclease domain